MGTESETPLVTVASNIKGGYPLFIIQASKMEQMLDHRRIKFSQFKYWYKYATGIFKRYRHICVRCVYLLVVVLFIERNGNIMILKTF